ncbi:MAG TPA: phosphoribosyltransferase [Cyanobacteria bacterium UBA8530]|nr:phosphoribosyltransferase [Cyanobacteria bacterium UBA8530]
MFKDRKQAGQMLAERLTRYRGKGALVLGLPRGGLAVARPIADALDLPLDIVVARKIGAPGNEEFAIGAVTARGTRVLNERVLREMILPPGYLEKETEKQRLMAVRREADLRGGRSMASVEGKIALLVDDGIATGMTVRAAIADLRLLNPSSLVVVAPVVAPGTLEVLKSLADEVVALDSPEYFYAIGQFYLEFPQVSDEEAKLLLEGSIR